MKSIFKLALIIRRFLPTINIFLRMIYFHSNEYWLTIEHAVQIMVTKIDMCFSDMEITLNSRDFHDRWSYFYRYNCFWSSSFWHLADMYKDSISSSDRKWVLFGALNELQNLVLRSACNFSFWIRGLLNNVNEKIYGLMIANS